MTKTKQSKHNCKNVSITKYDDKAEVQIKAEIPSEILLNYRTETIKKAKKETSIPGFRKGNAPQDVLIKHIGEDAIMQKTADNALTNELPLLLANENIMAISTPAVSITKLAVGNPLEFIAKVPIYPTVVLGDYIQIAKKINKEKEKVEVTDKDVNETITHLRRERAKIEKIEAKEDPQKAAEYAKNTPVDKLPEIDDSFVQSLGYSSAQEFKIKLKENIKTEKERYERDKTRAKIIEEIIKESKIPTPELLVNHELDKMEAQFVTDLEHTGTTMEKYLAQIKKTADDMRKEWRDVAKKRAQTQLAFAEIAKKESIEADKNAVEEYTKQAIKQQPNANEVNVRSYYENMFRNEAVLEWLEEQE